MRGLLKYSYVNSSHFFFSHVSINSLKLPILGELSFIASNEESRLYRKIYTSHDSAGYLLLIGRHHSVSCSLNNVMMAIHLLFG